MSENWIKISERKPPYGMPVYTRDDQGGIGVYTRYHNRHVGDIWTSRISTDNNATVEWLEIEDDQPCPRGMDQCPLITTKRKRGR